MNPDNDLIRTYAHSLLSVAKRQEKKNILIPEITELLKIFHDHPRFREFIGAPHISTQQRKNSLLKVFQDNVDPLIIHFFFLLIEQGRGFFAPDILDMFLVLEEHDRGIFEAQVKTAIHLSDSQKSQLQNVLERFSGIRLRIRFVEDNDIIGGIFFKYDDFMIDDTIRGKLDEIRTHLKAIPPM